VFAARSGCGEFGREGESPVCMEPGFPLESEVDDANDEGSDCDLLSDRGCDLHVRFHASSVELKDRERPLVPTTGALQGRTQDPLGVWLF